MYFQVSVATALPVYLFKKIVVANVQKVLATKKPLPIRTNATFFEEPQNEFSS